MEWKSDSPCHSHTYPGQECWSPGRCSSGELEFRDCGAIPWKGCCWLLRDRLRGCEGGDHGGKCWWKKARKPWKQGDTAESCVGGGAITIASFSPQKHQQLNRKAGPSNHWHSEGVGLTQDSRFRPWLQIYRGGPHPGGPSMCLNGWSYGERLVKEAFWWPATRGSKKDSCGAITSAVEAVCVPAQRTASVPAS